MTPESLPRPGDVIGGKYRVDGLSANGGMAAIFAGQHLVLGQRVAIKVMLAESAKEEAPVERFMREAQAAARVETEHVTRVMDAGLLDNGLPYLVMEFLDGSDLGAMLISRGPLECGEVVDLALEALEGLAHVHAAGIVHRDLKPSNLFLAKRPDGSNVVKLLDFGISKSLVEPQDDRVKALTGNVVIGSPVYMSPEQVKNARSVDARSDLWSLAVAIYELVTGKLPFDGDGVGEVLAQILDGQPKSMCELRPEVPAALDAVVMKCLSRDRANRYADVGEVARALSAFGHRDSAARVKRIEATLVNAPLSRTPTSLGSVGLIRATQVERVSDVIIPVGQRRDASGDFALSRTYADVPRSEPPTRAAWYARLGLVGAAAAVVMVVASYGWLRSAHGDAPARAAATMAVAASVAAPSSASPPVDAPAAAPQAPDSDGDASAQPAPSSEVKPAAIAKPQVRRPATITSRPSFLKSRK